MPESDRTRQPRPLSPRPLLIALLVLGWLLFLILPIAEDVYPGQVWGHLAGSGLPAWDASALTAADHEADQLKTDAYLIVQHGLIVHAYGDIDKPMNLASVRKSLLSILYGIYVEHGEIDLDRSLDQLGISDKGGLSEEEKKATIRQLLESRSGVYHESAYETDSEKAKRPARDSHAPGSFWYYNNWDFNTLGTIFQKLTGKTVFAALEQELALPLGFQDFDYPDDTRFIFEPISDHPAYIVHLSARDLARVGLLMARDGRWIAHEIVPPAWIDESTRAYSDTHEGAQGFGYMWWTAQSLWPFWHRQWGEQIFFGWGNEGQFLVVDPLRDLVIVHRVDIGKRGHGSVNPERLGRLLEKILMAMPSG